MFIQQKNINYGIKWNYSDLGCYRWAQNKFGGIEAPLAHEKVGAREENGVQPPLAHENGRVPMENGVQASLLFPPEFCHFH
ncbi:hypothetical protein PU629_18570 [Pullulanibacillus sp. KACC 23026]|uniref:hypothetical protein n=1 Tax=Pullulanibacillus sp. KACC 23026 TaxID=3028315 RepID=UPI0023AE6C31|nr:hypothetical protein [Pullulanibacillus sp. KACC 23026]WEG12103.1 hypothetical protein PU629_18570 [Pullulanibacillus sp. KACC 23026]